MPGENERHDKLKEMLMEADAAFGPPHKAMGLMPDGRTEHAHAAGVPPKKLKREMAFDEPLDPDSPLAVTSDMKEALRHDEARREAVARNKATNAHAMPPPPSPMRLERIAAAQRLRQELGGYATMPPDVRAHPAVREKLWPKVREYASMRVELAVSAVCDVLEAELKLTDAEFAELGYGVDLRFGAARRASTDDAKSPPHTPMSPAAASDANDLSRVQLERREPFPVAEGNMSKGPHVPTFATANPTSARCPRPTSPFDVPSGVSCPECGMVVPAGQTLWAMQHFSSCHWREGHEDATAPRAKNEPQQDDPHRFGG